MPRKIDGTKARADPSCEALTEALRGANRSVHLALGLYSADQTIETLRKRRESVIVSLCKTMTRSGGGGSACDDEALCCARLILGSKSSVTEETTIDGVLQGTYRSDITSDRLSGAGHTLQSLKQKLQSRSFGHEQLTALLSGLVLEVARPAVVRLLMASAGRDTDAITSSSSEVANATEAPLQPVVFATTASTPASPPQLSAGDRSMARRAARLLRDEFGGAVMMTSLCDALYAASAEARAALRDAGGAMKWLQLWPDVFSCVKVGTTLYVSLVRWDVVEEAAADDDHARNPPLDLLQPASSLTGGAAVSSGDAAASNSEQPESQVAFEEPITDILEHITGGASQTVFIAGGDILLPQDVVEGFGFTSSDMVKASDVRMHAFLAACDACRLLRTCRDGPGDRRAMSSLAS